MFCTAPFCACETLLLAANISKTACGNFYHIVGLQTTTTTTVVQLCNWEINISRADPQQVAGGLEVELESSAVIFSVAKTGKIVASLHDS